MTGSERVVWKYTVPGRGPRHPRSPVMNRETPLTCHAEIVGDDGILTDCGEEAVAMRLYDLHGDPPWPACDVHASPARYLGDGRWLHP